MDGLNEALPVKSVSIDNMLNQRDAVMERIAQAVDLLCEAREIALNAHIGFPRFKFEDTRYGDSIIDSSRVGDSMERMKYEVDRGAWQYLMDESGMRTFMDADTRKAWNEAIMGKGWNGRKGDPEVPEFNKGNVEATFSRLYADRGRMFENGVVAVFRALAWCYKTNLPQKFGKRIVLQRLRAQVMPGRWNEKKGSSTSLGFVSRDSSVNALDDMTRVMSILDGKPEPDHRNGWWTILGQQKHTTDPDAANDYMSVRCFRNGNAHVTFKRPDLVDQMNRILAKHYPNALPEPK